MTLITPDPILRARSLYELLLNESGSRILLAQQECPGRMHHDL